MKLTEYAIATLTDFVNRDKVSHEDCGLTVAEALIMLDDLREAAAERAKNEKGVQLLRALIRMLVETHGDVPANSPGSDWHWVIMSLRNVLGEL